MSCHSIAVAFMPNDEEIMGSNPTGAGFFSSSLFYFSALVECPLLRRINTCDMNSFHEICLPEAQLGQ